LDRDGNAIFAGTVISGNKLLATEDRAREIALDEIGKIVEADENGIIDKLSEIAAWINNDPTGATEIVSKLSATEAEVSALRNELNSGMQSFWADM
jgi:hypothetical protein